MSDDGSFSQAGVHRRFLEGAASKMLSLGVTFGEQILLVPVFLFYWGRESYGDWLALLSVGSFIAVLDLGLQGYYGNALQLAWARGQRDAFARMLRQSLAIYAVLVLTAVPVAIVVGPLAPWPSLLNLAHMPATTAATAMTLIALAIITAVPFGVILGLYRAHGDFALGVFFVLLQRLVLIGLTVAGLWLGAGAVILATIHLAVGIVGWAVALAHQRRRYPHVVPGFERPTMADLRKLAGIAPFYALMPAAMAFSVHGTVILIAGLAGAGGAVVVYTTLRTLTGLSRAVTDQLSHVAGVELARQYAQDDMEALRRMYRFAGRLAGGMAGAVSGMIAGFGAPFLAIWTLGRVPFDPMVFWPLLAAAALSGPTLAGNSMLYFINRPRGLAATHLAGGLVTLGLAALLVPRLGAAGAAIGLLTAELAVVSVAVSILAARVAGLPALRRIVVTQGCAAVAFATSAALAWGAIGLTGSDSLARLVVAGVLWLVVVPWPLVFVLFNAGQRRWIRDRIARRLRR
jgi:O-antigen/teichoic acid export membrane protein